MTLSLRLTFGSTNLCSPNQWLHRRLPNLDFHQPRIQRLVWQEIPQWKWLMRDSQRAFFKFKERWEIWEELIVQAYSTLSIEIILPWFINKILRWKVDSHTVQWSLTAVNIGSQNKISVLWCHYIQLRTPTVLTMGQRNLFFPEIKSHSKSREMNHSYLRVNQ